MTVYLDCNATTPIEPEVVQVMNDVWSAELGTPCSRHQSGHTARRLIHSAREHIAAWVSAPPEGVIFTSGGTEANNLAILGLEAQGRASGRLHIVTTAIEHESILDTVVEMKRRGFDVTEVPPGPDGVIDPDRVLNEVRRDTLLVSMQHVNHETGVIQSIRDVAAQLHPSIVFHVDASQSYGKLQRDLNHPCIDLISISAHKFGGPIGIGALIQTCYLNGQTMLSPIVFGGRQQDRLRPGTAPAALIAGFGEAARIAARDELQREGRCREFRSDLMAALLPLAPIVHGGDAERVPNLLNMRLAGFGADTVRIAWRSFVEFSTGSIDGGEFAHPSPVLLAMGVSEADACGALRLSWCHRTPRPNFEGMLAALRPLKPAKSDSLAG